MSSSWVILDYYDGYPYEGKAEGGRGRCQTGEKGKATRRRSREEAGRDQRVLPCPRNMWSHEKPEEAREDSLPEPSEGAWPCQP